MMAFRLQKHSKRAIIVTLEKTRLGCQGVGDGTGSTLKSENPALTS